MAKINFSIRILKKSSSTLASIYVTVLNGKKQRVSLRTDYRIPIKLWSNKTQQIRQNHGHSDFTKINVELSKLRSVILESLNELNHNSGIISSEWLKGIIRPDVVDKLKSEIIYLDDYIISFISKVESGKKLTREGKRYAKGTINGYKQLNTKLAEFLPKQKIRLDSVDRDFGDKFTSHLISQDLSSNYIGKVISRLKSIMSEGRRSGFVKNPDYLDFQVPKESSTNIYLSIAELNRINELDLSNDRKLCEIRDVFIYGAFIGQRVSDYNKGEKVIVSEHNYSKNGDKKKMMILKIYQEKTGTLVQIPLRTEPLKILEKYNFQLPKLADQKINDMIKHIGEMAKIDELTEVIITKGGRKITFRTPKFKLIKTHTARRSMITNMIIDGSLTKAEMMAISGHKTEKDFNNYVKSGYKDYLPNIIISSFFNA